MLLHGFLKNTLDEETASLDFTSVHGTNLNCIEAGPL